MTAPIVLCDRCVDAVFPKQGCADCARESVEATADHIAEAVSSSEPSEAAWRRFGRLAGDALQRVAESDAAVAYAAEQKEAR